MEFEDFRSYMDQLVRQHNEQAQEDFEGLSPTKMGVLLDEPFGSKSPLQLRPLAPEDYKQIPIFQQIKFLISKLQEGEIKLTAKGFLPTQLVADIYAKGFIKDEFIEKGIYKLYKETDAQAIHLSHLLLNLSGLTKKRKGKLSLTAAGKKIAASDQELLELIFKTMCLKFNWSYFDGYEDENVGQLGFAYSLLLLSKYGEKLRPAQFYVQKYLQAFPALLDGLTPEFRSREEYAQNMYSLRFFDRFLYYFNFISKSGEEFRKATDSEVKATPVFYKFISFDL